jgi:starch phosphorylase
MPSLFSYRVLPAIPPTLAPLGELAMNLRWSWDHDTIGLFRRMDRDAWEKSGHNPRLMLGSIDQVRLEELEADEAFLAHMRRVHASLRDYLQIPGWCARRHPEAIAGVRIAYFSAEFGLTECVPNYAGGLGILAGDHLKSASDLGLPLVGVGLLYQTGYFQQYLNADGWQQETYPLNDFYNLPLEPVNGPDGAPLSIVVEFPGRPVRARVWVARVGRVPLYLLDTNVDGNSPADRGITGALYGGDTETRIQQEIVLGIGGLRALVAMGLEPTVCHMNEGHSAFLGIERARLFMQRNGMDYHVARQATSAGNVFTTHTPVEAGFDRFDPGLVQRYLGEYAGKLGLNFDQFMALGRDNAADHGEPFNMAVLAARHSACCNAVSKLHGDVTRRMARRSWPGFPDKEIPIGYVTNGVHTRSWISHEMSALLDRYLGPRWAEDPTDMSVWNRVHDIPDEELWSVRQRRRERLISWARRRLAEQMRARGASDQEATLARGVLNSEVLTIGFARRFATYKRATLILRDSARLKRLLNDANRPVQIVVAGKAHPQDHDGKELIRQLLQFAHDPEVRRRVVFIENYDMSVARYLVQGVDLWLNTPRRPMEASGTSGMKLLANGGLNFSILDGWWAEAYDPEVGWAIGKGEDYTDFEYQDRVESETLYHVLENDIVPLFYERDGEGVPRRWISRMKFSMAMLSPIFNTNRMVAQYAERFYLPSAKRHAGLAADHAARARALMEWRWRVRGSWPQVKVERIHAAIPANLVVGASLDVTAEVKLGALSPQDVRVELYYGQMDPTGGVPTACKSQMTAAGSQADVYTYTGSVTCGDSGLCGFTVRVLPWHPDAVVPYEVPLIAWADAAVEQARREANPR